MEYQIIQATVADYTVLSEIALVAKAYWNYPKEWLDLWKADLVISPDMIGNNDTWKVISGDTIIGFTVIIALEIDHYEIEHCWIRPEHIGKGYGGKLLRHVLGQDKYHQKPFGVLADPNAVPFYQKFDFKTVKELPGKPEGRTLPWMEMVNKL